MKKSTTISLVFLFITLGCLCINPVLAGTPDVNPYGHWGMSPGDVLNYDVTSDNSGPWANSSVQIIIESNHTATIDSTIYDILNASIYNVTSSSYIKNPEIQLTGYNDLKHKWYGGHLVCLGFPVPVPLPFNLTMVNESIYLGANATGWGQITSNVCGGNSLVYSNGSASLTVTYDTENGICLENTIIGASSTWLFNCQCPWIPGYSPLIILGIIIIGLAALAYSVRRKKKL